MLIYYRFNNFCSFNCESEFSMSAPAGKVKKRFPDNYVETAEGFDLLKSAVIVGENAGGKSNFINSIKYLKSLFITNSQVKSVRPYVNAASLKEEQNPVQKFELCFRAENGKIYVYHLHLNESGIVYEELQTLKKRNAVASSLFKTEKQEGGSWIASAKEASGLSKRMDKFLTGNSIGLLVSKFAYEIKNWLNINSTIIYTILFILLIVLFIMSYRKQLGYIHNRIEKTKTKNS